MSDDFEEILKRWLRDRAGNDRSALQAMAGNVAALPPRRRRRPSALLPLAASIVVVVGLLAVLMSRQTGVGTGATPTPAETPAGPVLPGGPEAYAGDPRLAQCFGRGRYAVRVPDGPRPGLPTVSTANGPLAGARRG